MIIHIRKHPRLYACKRAQKQSTNYSIQDAPMITIAELVAAGIEVLDHDQRRPFVDRLERERLVKRSLVLRLVVAKHYRNHGPNPWRDEEENMVPLFCPKVWIGLMTTKYA